MPYFISNNPRKDIDLNPILQRIEYPSVFPHSVLFSFKSSFYSFTVGCRLLKSYILRWWQHLPCQLKINLPEKAEMADFVITNPCDCFFILFRRGKSPLNQFICVQEDIRYELRIREKRKAA